jgi:hypothetical protein
MADPDASQWVDDTMPNVPRSVGRVVNPIAMPLSPPAVGRHLPQFS